MMDDKEHIFHRSERDGMVQCWYLSIRMCIYLTRRNEKDEVELSLYISHGPAERGQLIVTLMVVI